MGNSVYSRAMWNAAKHAKRAAKRAHLAGEFTGEFCPYDYTTQAVLNAHWVEHYLNEWDRLDRVVAAGFAAVEALRLRAA